MKNILVIGIGSRIMKDDAIGIHVVEDLKQQSTNPAIKFILGETDVDYCIEEVVNFDFIIVIDAFLSGKQPGAITSIPINELCGVSEDGLYSMHGIHLVNALRGVKHFPEGIFIGIEPYEIDYGFTLSGQLQSRYNDILNEVWEHIDNFIEKYGGRKNA